MGLDGHQHKFRGLFFLKILFTISWIFVFVQKNFFSGFFFTLILDWFSRNVCCKNVIQTLFSCFSTLTTFQCSGKGKTVRNLKEYDPKLFRPIYKFLFVQETQATDSNHQFIKQKSLKIIEIGQFLFQVTQLETENNIIKNHRNYCQ